MNARDMRPSAVEDTCHYVKAMAYDANDNIEYVGKADIGSAKGQEVWQIIKLIYDANQNITDIQWASGTETFNKEWDERTNYAYS